MSALAPHTVAFLDIAINSFRDPCNCTSSIFDQPTNSGPVSNLSLATFNTSRTFFAFVWRRDRQGYANVHRQSVQAVTMDMLTVMLCKNYIAVNTSIIRKRVCTSVIPPARTSSAQVTYATRLYRGDFLPMTGWLPCRTSGNLKPLASSEIFKEFTCSLYILFNSTSIRYLI